MEEKSKFCKHCGKKLEKDETFCSGCGEKKGENNENKEQQISKEDEPQSQKAEIVKEKEAWSTGKLVIGIISMALFIIIAFQSCAAGIGNALEENNSTSGSSGIVCALLMLTGGIVTVATRNKKSNGGAIAAIIIYSIGGVTALSDVATFGDLVFWGTLSISFALVNLGSILVKQNKAKDIVLIIGIIAVSIFILIAFSPSKSTDQPEPQSEPNYEYASEENESYDEPEIPTTKKEYSKKEKVIYNGVKYSIKKIKYSYGNDWDKPAKGNVFVIVKIKIENTSDKKISYNPYDWKMRNSQGQEEDQAFTTIDSNTSLHSGDLAPGGTKVGTIVFEEPQNDKSLKLLYFDNSLFDEEEAFAIVIK